MTFFLIASIMSYQELVVPATLHRTQPLAKLQPKLFSAPSTSAVPFVNSLPLLLSNSYTVNEGTSLEAAGSCKEMRRQGYRSHGHRGRRNGLLWRV